MLEWEWYDDTNVVRLFLHLLLTANYEDKSWHGITIKRGQLLTSIQTLAEQTHLSFQQTRTALSKLKSTSEITSKSTNSYTLITICKYDDYQTQENSEQQTDNIRVNNQITNEQQATQQTDNNNIRNKEEKNNIITPLYSPKGETAVTENELTEAEVEIIGRIIDPTQEKEKSCAKKEKETKHKYGEYDNVLLTDTEAEKLRKEFGEDTLPIVMHFSELKAMKGYKYKSDYLAIRKWGAAAYYEHQKRNQNGNNADSFATIQERAARSVELGDAISRMWP